MDTTTATVPFAPLSLKELAARERAAQKALRSSRSTATLYSDPYGDALRVRLNLPR